MRKIEIFLCLSLLLPLPLHAQHKKIQCWTDEKGNRACGDQVPPQYAKEQRDILNSQGMVIQTEARQKTPTEIAADEKAAQEQKAAQEAATKQAAYDKFLVETYNSADDIKAARDLRVQAIDGRLSLAHKAVQDSEDALKDLHSRRDSIVTAGKTPDAKLLKQIQKFEKSVTDNTDAVNELQAERDHTQSKFDQDIARYNLLKSGTNPPAAPAQQGPPR